jgi:colicin import membrane protein
MSEQKESSVLFSLKELMNLEEDRIKTEEQAKAAAQAAAEQARAHAERAARDAEEARIRAEEERRRFEEQRSREESARLEAIRQAEIERARLEAEQHARMAAMTAQQQHEQKLAALTHDESKKKLRKTLIGVIAGVIVIGGLTTFFVVKSSQENEARIQAEAAKARELEEQNKRLEAQRIESEKKVGSLLDQLSSAKDEATRLALQKQLEAEQERQKKLTVGGGGRPAAGSPGGGAKPPCNCQPGDPLCSCL